MLGVDRSIPCGLILNELLTNAFKHAFPHGGPGEISVVLQEAGDGNIELSVADTGIGVPADSEGRGTLGLTLVRLLCEQLEGTLSITNESGTRYRIRFPRGGRMNGLRVLIVEDEVIIAWDLRETLAPGE